MQASLGDMVSSGPDHHNKVGIAIKQVLIFSLVEGLAFTLCKMPTLVKCNEGKCNIMKYVCIAMRISADVEQKGHRQTSMPRSTGLRCGSPESRCNCSPGCRELDLDSFTDLVPHTCVWQTPPCRAALSVFGVLWVRMSVELVLKT